MQLLDFVFAVVHKFVPADKSEMAELYHECKADMDKTITNPEHELYTPSAKAKILQVTKSPWVRLGIAVAYIPIVKMIQDFLTSNPEDENDTSLAEKQALGGWFGRK